MKRGSLHFIFSLLILMVVLSYCAKQASPTGGPKDETPPAIVKSVPVSGITNFKGREIEITFNEYVQLDKLSEKFMISPPVDEKPEIFLRGKSLFIKFIEELKDSTTYTLYFADAIKDLNEGNPINNFQFVFATGNVIDSLSVTGNVLQADNLDPAKNVLVILHSHLADSAPKKMLPDYITLADINGGFRIDNIKEGKYKMYALIDNNSNKRYDLADEVFAYLDTVVDINHIKNYLPKGQDTATVKSDVKPLKPGERVTRVKVTPLIDGQYKLFLSTAPKKKFYLTSSDRKQQYQFVYSLSLPPDTMDFNFDLLNGNKNWLIERSRARDTMVVWLRDSLTYSEALLRSIITYPFTDSTGKVISRQDTIPMRYAAVRTTRTRPVRNPLKVSSNVSPAGMNPGQKIIFQAATPMLPPDTSKVRIYESDAKTNKTIPWHFVTDSTKSGQLRLEARFAQEKKYRISLDRGTFRNIYGDYSDSTGISFQVRNPDSYGNLLLKITNVPCSIIVQLLSDKERLISEKTIKSPGNVQFPLLERGFYRLRAVYDLNGDGKWTTGDYALGKQPEPVSYLPKDVEIKVMWNHEEEWDTGTMNYKDQKLKTIKQ